MTERPKKRSTKRQTRDYEIVADRDYKIAAELVARYVVQFNPREAYGQLPDEVKRITDAYIRDTMKETWGPFLEVVGDFVRALKLSPGEEIVSVAVRDFEGRIRIVQVGR